MRVVLDTHAVLSASVFVNGRLAWLRAAWREGALTPLVSTATADELIRALRYPTFQLSDEDRQELLADFLPYAQVVSMPARLPRVPACRDPLDAPFLHLAYVAPAEY